MLAAIFRKSTLLVHYNLQILLIIRIIMDVYRNFTDLYSAYQSYPEYSEASDYTLNKFKGVKPLLVHAFKSYCHAMMFFIILFIGRSW